MSPANDITIRSGNPDDAAVIAEMVGELAAYEELAESNRSTEATIRSELSAPDRVLEVLLAFRGDEPVGMASFFMTYSTFAAKRGIYLEDIYVKPHERHHGIGTLLMQRVAAIAHERDCGRMEWATLLWNTSAIEFYEAMNATPNDAWTTYRLTGDSLKNVATGRAEAAADD